MIFDFLVQRVAVDSESCRCSGLHALALTQDLQNQLFFYDVDHLVIDVGQVLDAGLGSEYMLGINNRNLRTFATSLETTLDLLPLLPKGCEVVTESGIATPDDVARMRDSDVHRFLIGESLMRQPSPGKALKDLIA